VAFGTGSIISESSAVRGGEALFETEFLCRLDRPTLRAEGRSVAPGFFAKVAFFVDETRRYKCVFKQPFEPLAVPRLAAQVPSRACARAGHDFLPRAANERLSWTVDRALPDTSPSAQ
jgi:hypothetical protein